MAVFSLCKMNWKMPIKVLQNVKITEFVAKFSCSLNGLCFPHRPMVERAPEHVERSGEFVAQEEVDAEPKVVVSKAWQPLVETLGAGLIGTIS